MVLLDLQLFAGVFISITNAKMYIILFREGMKFGYDLAKVNFISFRYELFEQSFSVAISVQAAVQKDYSQSL